MDYETYFLSLLQDHTAESDRMKSNIRTSAAALKEHADELRIHVVTAQQCGAYRAAEAMTSAWSDLRALAKARE